MRAQTAARPSPAVRLRSLSLKPAPPPHGPRRRHRPEPPGWRAQQPGRRAGAQRSCHGQSCGLRRGLLGLFPASGPSDENPSRDRGHAGRPRPPRAGVSRAAAPNHTLPPRSRRRCRTRAFFKRVCVCVWGGDRPQPSRNARGQRRAGHSQGQRSSRGPGGQASAPRCRRSAGGRPGGGARGAGAEATWATGWLRGRRQAGPEGAAGRGAGRGRCGAPLTPSLRARSRAPRRAPASGRLRDCAGRLHAPLTGRRPNHSAQELVPRAGASASRGTWPGEGSPVRDRACAVARARPSAGKRHAQCEGTSGYVGARGMLGESRVPAHAQRRSEPATHWWREKREKSPQSYVRKGRVLWGGCGLPRGSAVLLGRGA